MPKTYRYTQNVGKARHVVSFHDGAKLHRDGSPFFDLRVFGRKRDAELFMRDLRRGGYTA